MWFASKTTNSNLLLSTDDGEDGYKELVVVIGYISFLQIIAVKDR
jgi:hypothetical protein